MQNPAPAAPRFVAYFRVSTDKQGRSGLGLEAQAEAVQRHAAQAGGIIVASFTEVESGKRDDRPELAKALAAARTHRAVLVVGKLDRLARDAHFLLGLAKAGVEFIAADMPHANRLTVGIMALVAEEEARAISARTVAALAAAKARGVKLGNPRLRAGDASNAAAARAVAEARAADRARDLAPLLAGIRAAGCASLPAIAAALNARGVPTPSGKGAWYPATVQRIEARAA